MELGKAAVLRWQEPSSTSDHFVICSKFIWMRIGRFDGAQNV
jgi:hypothetical protein